MCFIHNFVFFERNIKKDDGIFSVKLFNKKRARRELNPRQQG